MKPMLITLALISCFVTAICGLALLLKWMICVIVLILDATSRLLRAIILYAPTIEIESLGIALLAIENFFKRVVRRCYTK